MAAGPELQAQARGDSGSLRERIGDENPTPALADLGSGIVHVRAVVEGEDVPIADFTCTLHDSAATGARATRVRGYTGAVEVPIGRPVSVSVSAPGFLETLPIDASLQPGVSVRAVVARLVRVEAQAGVVLDLSRPGGLPVVRARITCSFQASERREGTDGRNVWEVLWQRESRAETGRHRVGDLASGRYRFRVQALETDGRPMLLLPETASVTFEAVAWRSVDLRLDEVGCGLVLDVRTADGRALGPELQVAVTGPSGDGDTVHWRAVDGEPVDTAVRALPATEPCELVEALPAGRYVVVVRGPSLALRRGVDLVVGQRALVRVP
ncbi:MAG: hypothetical protein R3F56_00975 [Planctomycetota bacterium]